MGNSADPCSGSWIDSPLPDPSAADLRYVADLAAQVQRFDAHTARTPADLLPVLSLALRWPGALLLFPRADATVRGRPLDKHPTDLAVHVADVLDPAHRLRNGPGYGLHAVGGDAQIQRIHWRMAYFNASDAVRDALSVFPFSDALLDAHLSAPDLEEWEQMSDAQLRDVRARMLGLDLAGDLYRRLVPLLDLPAAIRPGALVAVLDQESGGRWKYPPPMLDPMARALWDARVHNRGSRRAP